MLARKNKLTVLKTATIFVIFFAVVFLFTAFLPAKAQVVVPGSENVNQDMFGLQPVDENIALSGMDIRLIVARIIRAVLGLLGIITISLMMYAGYTIMTAGGNEEKITTGKKIMINATIGLAIILASFSITQFIINALSGGFNNRGGQDTIFRPQIETFSGSGALGRIIRDHYPERDQIGVKRNTAIIVTFAEPVAPSSIISNFNNSCFGPDGNATTTCDFEADEPSVPYFGDCLEIGGETVCDRLVTSSVQIFESDSLEEDRIFVERNALTNDNKTFVFTPIDFLGSDIENTWYTVDLTSNILKASGDESIFESSFSGHYMWEFETDTNFDFEPPVVISVNPKQDEPEVPKNRIITVNFSEAMNPMTVTGINSSTSNFYNLIINYATSSVAQSNLVSGEWRIGNGYRTVEFWSDSECGYNSCGSLMYCLPVVCLEDNQMCFNNFDVLLRSAILLPGDNFQADILTGITDASSNALDGNGDGTVNERPDLVGDFMTITDAERQFDNYWWNFDVQNKIDRSAPYIKSVTPNIDQGGVGKFTPVIIDFSKEILPSTYNYISILEYPNLGKSRGKTKALYPEDACFEEVNGSIECLDAVWFYRRRNNEGKNSVRLIHREFGPNNSDFYYFPNISSGVLDENQNCMYPGRGPDSNSKGTPTNCDVSYDQYGNVINISASCVGVNTIGITDSGCIETTQGKTSGSDNNNLDKAYPIVLSEDKGSIDSCEFYLKQPDVSPLF